MGPFGLSGGRRIAIAAFGAAMVLAGPLRAQDPTVVELTQTPCQFLEVEDGDLGFESHGKADCERINAETGAERLAGAKVLKLKPGDYVFRVTNESASYPLGFWLREEGYDDANVVKRLTMTMGRPQWPRPNWQPGVSYYLHSLHDRPR